MADPDASKWTVLVGQLRLADDAFRVGRHPNPTRSLLLGDPAGGALVYGCLIEADGVDELVNGISAAATFR